MHYLIGRKEYVYYFAEFVMAEIICIEAPDFMKKEDIVKLIKDLNYELIGVGKLALDNDFVQYMSMERFTEKYLYLRENKRILSGSLKEIDRYCEAIEKFYKNVQPN